MLRALQTTPMLPQPISSRMWYLPRVLLTRFITCCCLSSVSVSVSSLVLELAKICLNVGIVIRGSMVPRRNGIQWCSHGYRERGLLDPPIVNLHRMDPRPLLVKPCTPPRLGLVG